MAKIIIKKALTTEKSYNNQDIGIWTFVVNKDANKFEIKDAIEELFGVKVGNVTTTRQKPKIRDLKGSKFHTRRREQKIARISLKNKKDKIDLAKLKQ